ncbi:hypothetical protein MKW98_005701 [Papaver atlanticum]|uniref:Protein BIG GRAIN 1-like A n=1 Tax=Papaver atlanticum TaxID=357466 RepID=A0AAD4SM13_9MAGN|nr:hypothetical protein MKW98_005701 [Papaver atlanticum]
MDQLKWEKSLRESNYRHERSKNPSFSSSLLDEIYRSIDEGDDNGGGGGGGGFVKQGVEEVIYREKTMKKKQSSSNNREELIDNWMEKRIMSTTEKVVVRRNSLSADLQKNYSSSNATRVFNSSSSDSCYGSSGFSSSETDQSSIYSSSRSSSMKPPSIKPIRTSFSSEDTKKIASVPPQPKPTKKSRALKIYGDLKKVKQPISPGSKIASFINSLFTKENSKKPKFSSSLNGDEYHNHNRHEDSRIYKSGYGTNSTCSSVSSYSRSCLSKNNSNSSNRIKRSVRFYPVSVIVDEDCRPCGHKCLYETDEPGLMAKVPKPNCDNKSSSLMNMDEDLKFQIMEKNRRIEEKARDLLKGYQKKKNDYEMKDYLDEEDDDEDDDAASDASSDLFELSSINGGSIDQRYREELPVYETTHFLTNRAIANGLIR